MTLFDSHAHFAPPPGGDTAGALARAAAAGVAGVLAAGGDAAANEGARAAAAARVPGVEVFAAYGFDCSAGVPGDGDWERLAALLPEAAAIGEIALDGTRSVPMAVQSEIARRQLELARELDLPVTLHTRQADAETLAAVDSAAPRAGGLRGAVHCFTGSLELERALLDRGFAIGISGIATFPRGGNVREAAAFCPADRLLLETDSPFLAPVPRRGEKCEPAFVALTAEAVAKVRGTSPEETAALAAENAFRLFAKRPRVA